MVSVIIPNYNTEKYLKCCVMSVLKQTYRDLEIILVDDGSTDESKLMCDEFASIDKRVIVIHKSNGGLSSARNTGMEIAHGEYIVFLDSDDYLALNYIENSIKLIQENSADIAVMQMCYIAEKTNIEIVNTEQEEIICLNTASAIEASLYQRLYSCCAPAKLYRKEMLADIKFPVGKLSEDLAVCHKILANAKKVVYTNSYGYYYRQHETSIMHTFNPRRLDALQWTHDIENFCKKNYPEILNAAKCRTFNVAVHLILDLPDKGELHTQWYNKIWKEIVRTRKTVVFDKKVRYREKAAALLSYGGEKVLKLIWNSKVAVKQKER